MGKIGKTFTIDHTVYNWLANHAEKEGKKESYVVNAMLISLKRQFESWTCPECNATNDNQFIVCHGCDYILAKT